MENSQSRTDSAEIRKTQISGSAILLGALIAIALQVLMGFLGSALGLSVLDLREGNLPGTGVLVSVGIFAVLSVGFSFLVGGYIASRMSHQKLRFDSVIHGLGIWAVVTFLMMVVFARVGTQIGSVLATAGIGAGSAVTAGSVLKEISDLKPRIVTQMKILEGLAVTSFEMGSKGPIAAKLTDQVKEDVKAISKDPEVREDVISTGEKIQRPLVAAMWMMFFSLALGAFTSAYGAILGGRVPPASAQLLPHKRKVA